MNIFVLDKNPRIAALYHCDKHCVKMILETAQMLSTAHRFYNTPQAENVYKQAYKRSCPVEAYRAYYMGDKAAIAEWNWGTPAPEWFERNSRKVLQSAETVVQ